MTGTENRHAYCRAIEAYLCRKNGGHLVRIVGPAFERVLGWAEMGIPQRVVEHGIDRCVERRQRRGPLRRPVRIEYCEADVLDAFDKWRRAVGVLPADGDAAGPAPDGTAIPAARPRRSLPAHIEGLLLRLTALRVGRTWARPAADAIAEALRAVDALLARASPARGDERQALIDALGTAEHALLTALLQTLSDEERSALEAEARGELEPFRARMAPAAFAVAVEQALRRLVRHRFAIPDFGF